MSIKSRKRNNEPYASRWKSRRHVFGRSEVVACTVRRMRQHSRRQRTAKFSSAPCRPPHATLIEPSLDIVWYGQFTRFSTFWTWNYSIGITAQTTPRTPLSCSFFRNDLVPETQLILFIKGPNLTTHTCLAMAHLQILTREQALARATQRLLPFKHKLTTP